MCACMRQCVYVRLRAQTWAVLLVNTHVEGICHSAHTLLFHLAVTLEASTVAMATKDVSFGWEGMRGRWVAGGYDEIGVFLSKSRPCGREGEREINKMSK